MEARARQGRWLASTHSLLDGGHLFRYYYIYSDVKKKTTRILILLQKCLRIFFFASTPSSLTLAPLILSSLLPLFSPLLPVATRSLAPTCSPLLEHGPQRCMVRSVEWSLLHSFVYHLSTKIEWVVSTSYIVPVCRHCYYHVLGLNCLVLPLFKYNLFLLSTYLFL